MFNEENRENRTAYILFLTAAMLAFAILLWSGNLRFEARTESLVGGPSPVNFSEGWTLAQGAWRPESSLCRTSPAQLRTCRSP